MTDELLEQYDGLEQALDDVTAAVESFGVLHRVDGDGGAWCGTSGDFEIFETDDAIALGGRPCEACFGAAAEHLARADGTGVSRVDGMPETPEPTDVEHARPNDQRAKIDALTAEVLVATGGPNTFHAPASDDVAVCGEHVQGTRRRAEHAPPSTRPCRSCFSEEIVEKHAAREATAPTADAAADGGRPLNE